MFPRIRQDWRKILTRAWSVRLMILAGIFSGFEALLPFIDFLPLPLGTCAFLSFMTTCLAFWARFVAQKGISDGQ